GVVQVDARAAGVESGSGVRVADESADTTLSSRVDRGGLTISAVQIPAPIRPGARNTPVLTLLATNDSPLERMVTSVVLANRSTGTGTTDQLDAELGDLTLYRDDGNGVFDPARDALL